MTAPTAPSQPLLVTLGDPAGIGPEIVVQALQAGELSDCVVVGHLAVLRRGACACGISDEVLDRLLARACRGVWSGEGATGADPTRVPPHGLPPLLGSPADWAALPWGVVDARCGAEAARMLAAAVARMRRGQGRAIVTAPIHKEALAAAGVSFPGHTEMLQAWCADVPPPVRMMLANGELRVVLVTIHQSLRQAIEAVTFEAVLQTLQITDEALRRWGIEQPRLAVAGLNPHAGEGGLFGTEELQIIGPAVAQAQRLGIRAEGPFPPDTVFMRARSTPQRPGSHDAVVAMTHDHGLIPVKYLGVEQGVNITLGLPFVRTSPDHGTAFDIAGQGRADPASLIAALQTARRLTRSGQPDH